MRDELDKDLTIGQRLVKARKYANLKQNEVAKMIGIHKSTLSKYENDVNEPDSDALVKLSNLYNVTIDYLLSGRLPYGIIPTTNGDDVNNDPMDKLREWKIAHDNAYYHLSRMILDFSTQDLKGLVNISKVDLRLLARSTTDKKVYKRIINLLCKKYGNISDFLDLQLQNKYR